MSRFEVRNVAPEQVAVRRYVHVVGTSVWVCDAPIDESWPVYVVGMLEDACWFAVDVPGDLDPSDGAALDLRTYYGRADEAAWLAAGRAVQLAEWARTHRFCGRCGTPTVPAGNERAMRCPACALVAFPRLAPAMITLVTRGQGPTEEVLLARGVHWTIPMYSCLAGFVEPGESLEAAVVREVSEEVGLVVGDITYRGSQPWPFPHSLMIGFRARCLGGDLTLDGAEIADAGWYRRGQLPMVPPRISIARRLIDEWVDEWVDAVDEAGSG